MVDLPRGQKPARATGARKLKRSAALMADEDNEVDGGPDPMDDSHEAAMESEADWRQRLQEREWLQHKMRKQRKEEHIMRVRQAEAEKARRATKALVAAVMSSEDRQRFRALEGAPASKAALRARVGSLAAAGDEEDMDLLGGAKRGAQRKQWFLLGGGPAVPAG